MMTNPSFTGPASSYGASLYLLHVIDAQWIATSGSVAFPEYGSNILERLEKYAEKGLIKLAETIGEIDVVTSLRVGSPHVQIVQHARDEDIDLVVVATHGRSGLKHALIGSVAEKIVQMAPCPVLTVKHPEHEFIMP
ncbi:MAG: universal stress protein UspA [Gemmatimonadetes bacterium]|nr:universal stress protein UspA [Gemmatimonadota bacterium]